MTPDEKKDMTTVAERYGIDADEFAARIAAVRARSTAQFPRLSRELIAAAYFTPVSYVYPPTKTAPRKAAAFTTLHS